MLKSQFDFIVPRSKLLTIVSLREILARYSPSLAQNSLSRLSRFIYIYIYV